MVTGQGRALLIARNEAPLHGVQCERRRAAAAGTVVLPQHSQPRPRLRVGTGRVELAVTPADTSTTRDTARNWCTCSLVAIAVTAATGAGGTPPPQCSGGSCHIGSTESGSCATASTLSHSAHEQRNVGRVLLRVRTCTRGAKWLEHTGLCPGQWRARALFREALVASIRRAPRVARVPAAAAAARCARAATAC
jgi:hypothetical protein